MPRASIEPVLSKTERVSETITSRLSSVEADGRRLALFRRVLLYALTGIMIAMAVLAPQRSAAEKEITILALIWLMLFLPTIKVLIFEARHRQLVEVLRSRPRGQNPGRDVA